MWRAEALIRRSLASTRRSFTARIPSIPSIRHPFPAMSTLASSSIAGPVPRSSPLDDRAYKTLTLSNGLKVLLVSDSDLDKAAAALDVSVGFFNDPIDLPGLAHFLEHMLFLGTAKYPDEESYSAYLGEKGGYSNAYTSCENTNYQFQLIVPKEARDAGDDSPLYEALDRFAQFFIAPLFTEGATERELNAVDSEHQKNVQNDGQRIFQLSKSVANPAHPYSRFGTGSKATLWDEPRVAGIDTRDALLAFHSKYYSANLMRLCITSPHSLDLMERWAVELFSAIENKDAPEPCKEYEGVLAMTEKEARQRFSVVPIKDIRLLSVSWITPAMEVLWEAKPSAYVSHMMGHEGEGALLALLKERGWADDLSAGDNLPLENFGIFCVTICLTKEGVEHVDDIVELLYGYIKLIRDKGIEKWIHDESAALGEMSFRFAERVEPFYLVQTLSERMRQYPEESYLSGPYLIPEYSPAKITDLLNCLTPANSNVMVVGSFNEGKTDTEEKWYGTAYRMDEIPTSIIERWTTVVPDPSLAIPGKNPFIPTNFDLTVEPLNEGEIDLEGPTKIVLSEKFELHHKLDRSFKRPKVALKVILENPVTYASAKNLVLTKVFIAMLKDDLKTFAYDAEIAGLGYDVDAVDNGLVLSLSGYNDKILVLLNKVLEKMTRFCCDPDRFAMICDQLERTWANFDLEQPYSHALYGFMFLTQTPRWHISQYLAHMRDGNEITMESVNNFVPCLLEKMRAVIMVHGNVSEDWARNVCSTIEGIIPFQPLSLIERPLRRVVILPTEFAVVTRKVGTNPEDNNSAIHLNYQIGPRGDFGSDVALELLTAIMEKPAFHELRTKLQLGYMVFTGIDRSEDIRGLYCIIQSTVADPDELDAHIEAFLAHFRKETLKALSVTEFDSYVESAIATKLEKDKRMSQRTRRFYSEVDGKTFLYDRREKEIAALRKVQKSDVVVLFDRYIAVDAPERRKIASMVFGCDHPMADYGADKLQNGQLRVVSDPVAFRMSRPLFPALGKHGPYTAVCSNANGSS